MKQQICFGHGLVSVLLLQLLFAWHLSADVPTEKELIIQLSMEIIQLSNNSDLQTKDIKQELETLKLNYQLSQPDIINLKSLIDKERIEKEIALTELINRQSIYDNLKEEQLKISQELEGLKKISILLADLINQSEKEQKELSRQLKNQTIATWLISISAFIVGALLGWLVGRL